MPNEPTPTQPSLAVCISTHGGGSPFLADAVDAVTAQIEAVGLGERVSIVVDGDTPDADYLWLFSADDVPAPGAVARVVELLDEHAGVPGLSLNRVVFDAELRRLADEQPTYVVPALGRTTLLRGMDEIVGALGWVMAVPAYHVVRNSSWRDAAPRGELVPHTARMLAMAARDPRWVWVNEKLVLVRPGTVAPLPVSLARLEAALMAELDALWRDAAGAWGRGHREAVERYLRAVEWRVLPGSPRERLGLLARLARLYGRLPSFWLRTLPRATRNLPSHSIPLTPMDPFFDESDRTVGVAAPIPAALGAADMVRLECVVHNETTKTLRSSSPAPVYLASRWRRPGDDAGWVEGARVPLPHPVSPGGRATIVVPVVAPWEPGTWELRVAAVQEGIAWLGTGTTTSVAVSRE